MVSLTNILKKLPESFAIESFVYLFQIGVEALQDREGYPPPSLLSVVERNWLFIRDGSGFSKPGFLTEPEESKSDPSLVFMYTGHQKTGQNVANNVIKL